MKEENSVSQALKDEVEHLEQEISSCLNDPEFWALVEDPEFQKMLDDICRRTVNRKKPSSTYSQEDLRQDVLINYGRALPYYQGEVNIKALLSRIARNQLIDVYRRPDEHMCCSLDDLVEKGSLIVPQQGAAEDMEHSVRIRECLSTLDNNKERRLFLEHCVECKSLTEIADQRGVTRQAISKQWRRIADKLEPIVR